MIGAKREAILSAAIDLMNRPGPQVSLGWIKPLDLLGTPSDRQRAVGIGGAPSIAFVADHNQQRKPFVLSAAERVIIAAAMSTKNGINPTF